MVTQVEPAVGTVLYGDRWLKVDVIQAYRSDGTPFPHRRVHLGKGPGAIIICLAGDQVAMVRQPRPAAGIPSSLELVQGETADHSPTPALNKLLTETGLAEADIISFEQIGSVFPDPSMVCNKVFVWLAESSSLYLTTEAEWQSGGRAEWMPLADLLASDEVVSGMTMSALHLYRQHLARSGSLPTRMAA